MNDNNTLHHKINESLEALSTINKRIAALSAADLPDFEALRSESLALHKLILQLNIAEARTVAMPPADIKPIIIEEKPSPFIEAHISIEEPETVLETIPVEEVKPIPEPEKIMIPSAPEPIVQEKKAEVKKTVVDNIVDTASVNDKFIDSRPSSDLAAKFNGTPISDLKKAISISKKFEFINGLFKQNHELYTRSIHSLNTFEKMDEAESFLKNLAASELDPEHEGLMEELHNLIRRRYQS